PTVQEQNDLYTQIPRWHQIDVRTLRCPQHLENHASDSVAVHDQQDLHPSPQYPPPRRTLFEVDRPAEPRTGHNLGYTGAPVNGIVHFPARGQCSESPRVQHAWYRVTSPAS